MFLHSELVTIPELVCLKFLNLFLQPIKRLHFNLTFQKVVPLKQCFQFFWFLAPNSAKKLFRGIPKWLNSSKAQETVMIFGTPETS